jgi:NaMN:DMB phosphoribosyltransferase
VLIGTTGWLADEGADAAGQSPFGGLVDATASHLAAALSVLACGVRFHSSTHQPLRDYERGYVKEGVGAGASCCSHSCAVGPVTTWCWIVSMPWSSCSAAP